MAGLEIEIAFPGNKRVDAKCKSFTIQTDQTVKNGGDETAPEPYDLFLSSIGTCAGYYVLAFCKKRDIPYDEITLVQRHEFSDPGHILTGISLQIRVPAGFPEKYRKALVQAAGSCGVKKAITNGPEFTIETTVAGQ